MMFEELAAYEAAIRADERAKNIATLYGDTPEWVRANATLKHRVRELEAIVDQLREEFTVLMDACGHCLAAGRPPVQGMLDMAREALAQCR